MLKESFTGIFIRDLNKLKDEIGQYKSDTDLWELKGEIKNSPGTLCLHLVGNLNHFIGAVLGNTGYIRNRDAEFATRDVLQKDLIAAVENVSKVVEVTLNNLPEETYSKIYPGELLGRKDHTTDYILIHLLGHFNYHLGQINYHRRMI